LEYDHSKGLFPATPLSATPLYLALIHKMCDAAHYYGHALMYPFIFMLSERTNDETINFLMASEEWEEAK